MKDNFIKRTPDHTEEYDPEDVKKGALLSVLSYIFVLVLIPIISEKSTEYTRFHIKQGALLSSITTGYVFLMNGVIGIARARLGSVGAAVTGLLLYAVLLFLLFLFCLGIRYAVKHRAKELPGFSVFFRKKED